MNEETELKLFIERSKLATELFLDGFRSKLKSENNDDEPKRKFSIFNILKKPEE